MVAGRESQEEGTQNEVADGPAVFPDERAVQEQHHEQEVQRVDLRNRGCGPDGGDRTDRQRRGRGDDRADTQPQEDRNGDRQGAGDKDGRQQVGSEGDRPERDQLREPGQHEVGRVSGGMGDTQHVRDRLHLTPIAERHPGQQGARVHDEGDDAHDQRRETRECRHVWG